ncbi:MAG: histidine--tRNA ligase [Acidimicrobiia bacterium]
MPADRDAFRAPVGTHDVLPPDSEQWIEVIARFADRAARFGYGLIVTPVFEHREVFERAGVATDVVRKEMYDFEDKGGRAVALRPEGTAPVVRAFVQHRPPVPWKTWYLAPNLRYERPQRGRYRQHWQLGAEAIGVSDPEVDIEVIDLAHGFYRDVGASVTLLLNSMGDEQSRPAYVAVLREYLLEHGGGLGPEFRERVEQSPLRVLDAKRDDWQEVIERAPQLTEYLSDEAQEHFERVQLGLDAIGIDYELAPRLVRGFDYYTSTTFEFASDALDAAQNAVGGGGRYDRLSEEMGGPPAPGIGFGIGIERVLLAMGSSDGPTRRIDVFVVGGPDPMLVHELRESGLATDEAFGDRSWKAQLKAADRAGAAFAVLLGAHERARGAVAVKRLESAEQVEVPREQLVGWLQAELERAS